MLTAKEVFTWTFDLVKTLAVVFVVAFLIRFFIMQPFLVEGSSMEPNFHDSEYLLVDKVSFKSRPPKRGEVVVFHPPENSKINFIKRIVGLPFEEVEIRDGEVFVEGKHLSEPYLPQGRETFIQGNQRVNFHKELLANEFFVMGDNRAHSSDSREWGPVTQDLIIGRAWLALWPFSNLGFVRAPTFSPVSAQ